MKFMGQVAWELVIHRLLPLIGGRGVKKMGFTQKNELMESDLKMEKETDDKLYVINNSALISKETIINSSRASWDSDSIIMQFSIKTKKIIIKIRYERYKN